jgi:hypothetical protein
MQAVKELAIYGFELATSDRTVGNWNKAFRRMGMFPHPNPIIASGITPEAPIFVLFPEAKTALISFARDNLDTLSTDSLHLFVTDTLLPLLYSSMTEIDKQDEACMSMVRRWREKPPSPVTTSSVKLYRYIRVSPGQFLPVPRTSIPGPCIFIPVAVSCTTYTNMYHRGTMPPLHFSSPQCMPHASHTLHPHIFTHQFRHMQPILCSIGFDYCNSQELK